MMILMMIKTVKLMTIISSSKRRPNPGVRPLLSDLLVIMTLTIKIVSLIMISDDENCYSDDD